MNQIKKIIENVGLILTLKEAIVLGSSLVVIIGGINFDGFREWIWQIISGLLLLSNLYFMFKFWKINGKPIEKVKKNLAGCDKYEMAVLQYYIDQGENVMYQGPFNPQIMGLEHRGLLIRIGKGGSEAPYEINQIAREILQKKKEPGAQACMG